MTSPFQIIGDVIEFRGEPVAKLIPLVSENRFLPELREQVEYDINMPDDGDFI